MTEQEALERMYPPGRRRKGIWRGGVLQIWTTRACDKACFGCTQHSNLAGKPTRITPDQFETACKSLAGYFGVVGIFGGNPCTHPEFETLCEILAAHFPFEQRGLWSNNLLGKGVIARRTFNPDVSNLNVHLDQAAFDEFRSTWPESKPFGLDSDSRHAPPFVALQDVVADPAEQWDLIGHCDINRRWSAMISVFRGELRGYFCEIAGSQAMLHQHEPDYPDLGVDVIPGWWQRPMADFAGQVRFHCRACGIPLNAKGPLAQDETGTEQVSQTHVDAFHPKRPGRLVQLVTSREQLAGQLEHVTDYVKNASL